MLSYHPILCSVSGSSSSSLAAFRNTPPHLEGHSDFDLNDFSSFDLQNEDPQDSRHKRSVRSMAVEFNE